MADSSTDIAKRRKDGAPLGGVDAGYATGYETDSFAQNIGKKSVKTKLKKKRSKAAVGADPGYETDDGYVSSAPTVSKGKKSRMFRLGNRSKTNVRAEPPPLPPPLPEPTPVFRLPIAARFATTLGDLNANATVEPPVLTPVPPPTPLPAAAQILPLNFESPFTDQERTSFDIPESTTTRSVDHSYSVDSGYQPSSRRRNNASSDSSDAHGSSHSFFSKWTASSVSSSSVQSKHPTISYPLTRSPSSPSRSVAQKPELSIDSSLSPLSDSRSRNPSPGGWSSPVVVTSNPAASEEQSGPPGKRPFFLARNMNPPSPKQERPALTVVASADYIVPSPGAGSPLPSRPQSPLSTRARSPFQPPPSNLLAQRDLPLPSPPPTMSLPKVPADQDYFSLKQSHKARQRRQFVINTRPTLVSPTLSAPMRGRESPFPARPVLGTPSVSQIGLEARVKVKRYRDLYALPKASWDDSNENVLEDVPDVMRDVIVRFRHNSDDWSGSEELQHTLGRNQSSEALDAESYYPDDEREKSPSEDGGRLARWSGEDERLGISIMDIETSEMTRGRFVQRIEQLFDRDGRELQPQMAVPTLSRAYSTRQTYSKR